MQLNFGRLLLRILSVLAGLLLAQSTAYAAPKSELQRLVLSLASRQGALQLIDKKLTRKSEAAERGNLLLRRAELLTDIAQLQQHLADEGHASKDEWRATARLAIVSARSATGLLVGSDKDHARFLAGRNAYELGDRAQALAQLAPAAHGEGVEALAAALLAGEIFNAQGQFSETVALLEPIASRLPAHSKALRTVGENLAWGYYHAKRYREAVSALRRAVGEPLPPSARPVLAHFLATAGEEHVAGFSVAESARLLSELAAADASARKDLFSEYAKALANQHQGPALLALAKETSDLLDAAGVYDLRLRAVGACVEVSDFACAESELKALHSEKDGLAVAFTSDEAKATYRKILEDSANRMAARLHKSHPTLAAAYGLALVFAPRADEARLQFNAGEAAYGAQAYEVAVTHYRRAADVGDGELSKRAALRAVAARYAGWTAGKRLPGELRAVAAAKATPRELEPAAREWLSWVEELPKDESGFTYRFEAYRLLYSEGHVEESCRKLVSLAEKFPSSKVATKAAALVLDTDLAGAEWDRAAERITRFLKQSAWEKTPFHSRLLEVGPQVAHHRILEAIASGDNARARKVGESALATFPPSAALAAVTEQLGNVVLAMGDSEGARAVYQKASVFPNERQAVLRLQARGELAQALAAENRFDFTQSARHYRRLLALGREAYQSLGLGDSLGARILETAWRGEPSELEAMLEDKSFCLEKMAATCERYRALLASQAPKLSARAYLERAEKASDQTTRFAYATAAMADAQGLPVVARLRLLDLLAPPSEVVLSLRAALLSRFDRFLDGLSDSIATSAPVKLDRLSLSRRRDLVESFGKALAAFDDVSIAPLKTSARLQRARAFRAFASEIEALPAPAGLTAADREAYLAALAKRAAPFSDKAAAFAQAALEESWALPGSRLSTRVWEEQSKAHPEDTASARTANELREQAVDISGLAVFTGKQSALARRFREDLRAHRFAGASAVLDGLRQAQALHDGEEDFLNGALALTAGDAELASRAFESARLAHHERACAELSRIYLASHQLASLEACKSGLVAKQE